MTENSLHEQVERQMNELLAGAGLPEADDVARLERAVIFLWYETKAFVLVDLDELPAGEGPLDALDIEVLRADILGLPLNFPFPPVCGPGEGYSEAC